ncbi:MAG: DNA topoisomerase IV subunit A [Buchananella hordeovulneris]|nr:DNA topoisomerase IV subunit A [Buchananella hordeovulneris]
MLIEEEASTIIDIDVSTEMETSFLEYAYSVIYARALPDARDGLKPVQRRILYQMGQMGLSPEKGHVKSARVVGEVMGKLHPHGDAAIYDALVRMAQPFSLRLPLIDGHGNFGSLDDGPAASRYTEARLAPPALAMIADLGEDVVDMVPNYDNQLLQPEVLPAAIPALLVNGASGIAVGMATNMAPHNLGEVMAAARHLVSHPQATIEEIERFVPGPDLPGGGMIVGLEGVREAARTGRGAFKTRAKARIERITARKYGIVVTELPYLVGTERVIEKIKDGVQARKLEGISKVEDHTDRAKGMRLVIEIKAGFNPEAVLAQLYKHTPLEDNFAVNNVALVDGQPRTLGLLELLRVFVDHRLEVVRRRSRYRVERKRERAHLIAGLLLIMADIDECIAVIRTSDDAASARDRLMQVFDLSEVQAEHILALRLRRLTKFSRLELEAEADQLAREIAELEEILGDDAVLRNVVSKEMAATAERFATPRRTVLLEESGAASLPGGAPAAAAAPLEVADEPCRVLLSTTGLLARVSGAEPMTREGGRCAHDALLADVAATTRGRVGLVLSDGTLARINVVEIPALPRTEGAISLAGGTPAQLLLPEGASGDVLAVASLAEDAPPLGLVTRAGKVKRVGTAEGPARSDHYEIITLEQGDCVVYAREAGDDSQFVLISSDSQLLRFEASKVRVQGRSAGGMAGLALREGAHVIGGGVVPGELISAATVVTAAGTAASLGTEPLSTKVTPLDRYPSKGRGTQGVRVQRLLTGQSELVLGWAGLCPARAVGQAGQPLELPAEDERRDASGELTAGVITSIG